MQDTIEIRHESTLGTADSTLRTLNEGSSGSETCGQPKYPRPRARWTFGRMLDRQAPRLEVVLKVYLCGTLLPGRYSWKFCYLCGTVLPGLLSNPSSLLVQTVARATRQPTCTRRPMKRPPRPRNRRMTAPPHRTQGEAKGRCFKRSLFSIGNNVI
jgi:hypothetical protein